MVRSSNIDATVSNRASTFAFIAALAYPGPLAVADGPPVSVPTWVRCFNGPTGNGRDEAFDLAVGLDGSVAVAGRSRGDTLNDDFVTITYGPNGEQRWSNLYDGENVDEAKAVAIDHAGHVYVTGASWNGYTPNGTEWDYVTIKYHGVTGQQMWLRRFDGPGQRSDLPQDMVVDGQGNVYIAGFAFKELSQFGFFATHFHVIKYDTNGNVVWQHVLDLTPHEGAGARAIVMDGQGNVYACGQTGRYEGGSTDDMMIVKVNSAGEVVYMATVDAGPLGDALAITCDESGNAYVTGFSAYDNGKMWEKAVPTVKIGPSGQILWERYLSVADGANHAGWGIVVDGSGNVYTVGGVNMGENRAIVVSYDSNGTQRWLHVYDVDPNNSFDDAWMSGARLGSDGNIYVNATVQYPGPEGYDFTTFVYSPTGTVLDQKRVNLGSTSEVCHAFALGPGDSIYWTGFMARPVTGVDVATAKLGATPVPGDITGDGVVNVSDLLAVINNWGPCPAPPQSCPADVAPAPDGDGVVNVSDLLYVINHWG